MTETAIVMRYFFLFFTSLLGVVFFALPSLTRPGLFFAVTTDPAILVEKRFGIGYTLNFGNPWSWAIIAVVIAGIAVHPWF